MKTLSELLPLRPAPRQLLTGALTLERVRCPALHLPPHYHPTHLIVLYQAPNVPIYRQQGSQRVQDRFGPGDVGVYPAGEYDALGWDAPVDNLQLSLDTEWLADQAERNWRSGRFRLPDQFRRQDSLLSRFGQQLSGLSETGSPLETLYAESLATTLVYHLLTQYGHFQDPNRWRAARLDKLVLGQIDDFIDAHLDAQITLQALAVLAHLSPFHFARLFRQVKGCSPYEYVLSRKLAEAQRRLRRNDDAITAIGQQLGFSSASQFARFFRQRTGCSPGQYRRAKEMRTI